MTETIVVHNPLGFPPLVTGKRLAQRLESLEGRTVFLVDCLFDNSAVFMRQLDAWMDDHLPGVLRRHIKPRESWQDDPEMRAAIEADADAAILGVGL